MLRRIKERIQNTKIYYKNVEYRSNKHYRWLKKYNERKYNEELNEIIKYIEESGIQDYTKQLYYEFCNQYEHLRVDIFFDEDNRMYYACGENTGWKRMYFARSINTLEKAFFYYKSMCIEQNRKSPHCYLSDTFFIESGEIVLDIGAADGNFSLSVIDLAQKVYLFECDPEWIEALQMTFKPFKEKVVIINKFVSNKDGKECITLDNFFASRGFEAENNFVIKMDIEGAEKKAVQGMKQLLQTGRVSKIAICTYHNQADEKKIRKMLCDYNCTIENAHGYIMRLADIMSRKPFYRRGVLRVKVNREDVL